MVRLEMEKDGRGMVFLIKTQRHKTVWTFGKLKVFDQMCENSEMVQ